MTARRRGHGEGTIYHRPDGRWEAVVDLGWQDGKRRRKYLYGRTRREVAEKLARALRRVKNTSRSSASAPPSNNTSPPG